MHTQRDTRSHTYVRIRASRLLFCSCFMISNILMWWHWVMTWMLFEPFWTSCMNPSYIFISKYALWRTQGAKRQRENNPSMLCMDNTRKEINYFSCIVDDNATYMHHKYYYKTQSNLTPCSYFIWCTFEVEAIECMYVCVYRAWIYLSPHHINTASLKPCSLM